MDRITKIIQETHHRFLNLFCMDVRHRNGEASEYYVASRAKSEDDLKAVTHRNDPDGVSIYSVYGEQRDLPCATGSSAMVSRRTKIAAWQPAGQT